MRVLLAALMIVLAASAGAAAASAANRIVLKHDAVYTKADITLADVASVLGPDAHELGGIVVARAPSGATGMALAARTVEHRVQENFPKVFTMEGPDRVRLVAARAAPPRDVLARVFMEEVMRRSPWKERGKYEVSDVSVYGGAMVVPEDLTGVRVIFSPAEDFLGLIRASVILGQGPEAPRVVVTGRARLAARVPVVKRVIPSGAVVHAEDVEEALVDITADPRVCSRREELEGKRAKVTLRPGKAVSPSQVEVMPDVCAGEEVGLRALADNIVVEARGKAIKDGRAGQKVPVKNLASGKVVVGTVIAPSLVQVEL